MLDDYQRLAAVIAATGEIDAERLQRIVFVLQALGAPLRYTYRMHFGDSYSEDLEADQDLLVKQGFVEARGEDEGKILRFRPTRAAAACLEQAEDVRAYVRVIEELRSADPRVLDFAATFGAWREFRYGTRAALERTREAVKEGSPREVAAEGERFLERLGLLTGA
jgi:uncharacterized protein YwgA